MGEFLQRYKLAGTYEQGLTGRGFLATDLNHNRLVVIKMFTCPSTASARRAFALWPQLTHLRHKNLITTLNAFVEENQLYLVYDYAGGNSLDRLLRNKDTTGTLGSGPKTLALEIVTQIARQSLAALDYLHAIGTVHGAIRPENILVGDEVKLADAGLSSITAAIEEQPPEEFQPQTDLYQLGLVLLRATLGRRAEQLTLEETSAGKVNTEFEHRLEQLPEKIRSLLRGLCSPDATQRFTSVSEALASFEDTGRVVTTTPKLNLEEWVRQREIKLAQAQVGLNQTTDLNTRSKLYCEIVAALFDKSEFEDALKQCRAGLAELENLPGHEAARKRLLTKEAEILTWLGNTEPAQQLVEQVLSLNQGDESPEGKLLDGCSKVAAARIYQALGQHELVKNLLDEALPLFQQAGEPTGEIDVYLLRAFALIWIENNAEYALQMLKQLQERCCQLQYGWGFLQCMRLISICYSTLENFGITHVLQNFEEMLEYAKALEMRHYIAIAALNLGIMECKNIRLERGLELTEEALEIGAKLGDRRLIAYAQSVVCETLGELGRLQEAVEHGRRGLRFVKEFAEQRSIFEVCDQYTTALWQSGEVQEGERLLLQYLGGEVPETYQLAFRSNLIWLYLSEGRLEETRQQLELSRQLSKEIERTDLLLESHILEIEVELATNPDLEPASLLEQANRLLEQARQHEPIRVVTLLILGARLLARQGHWEESKTAFTQAIEQAEQEKRLLLQAEAYYRFGESMLERIKQGDNKPGMRSRAVGMLARAADLYRNAGAVLLHQKVSNLLADARSVGKS